MTTWAERAEQREEFERENHQAKAVSALDRVVIDNSRKRDDCIDARAELAALRATIAEQARRLEEARAIIDTCASLWNKTKYFNSGYNEMCRAWLAANAPAPQAEREQHTPDESLGKWVYCNQHRKPHESGWCTVSNRDKLGLGVDTAQEALQKCRDFGLPIYSDKQVTSHADPDGADDKRTGSE